MSEHEKILGKLAAKKREYALYEKADNATRILLDGIYEGNGKTLIPKVAIAIHAACGEIPDETLINDLIFHNTDKTVPNIFRL